ncbi:hypothetical protein BHE74_00004835 [Ensete ventricosum]|nr:hypothetical protein BHE74_00004835 [Ensete ventricosum]
MPKRPAVTKHYLPLHSFPFPTYTTDVSLPASWLDGVMVRHAGPAGGMALISSKVGGRRSRWSIGVGPGEEPEGPPHRSVYNIANDGRLTTRLSECGVVRGPRNLGNVYPRSRQVL